jgi:predicted  nucleic acid-binding Zn-ribbon protein
MRAFVFICGAALVLALGLELLAPGYGPALLERLLSRPVPQQFPWTVICVVALVLLGAALLLSENLVRQRKATALLEMRLRGVRHAVSGLEEAQKDGDAAADYLTRTDPEGAISALQGRLAKAEQAAQLHHGRNEAGDLVSRVELVRQQQVLVREKLGDVIGKRRSIEALFAELQSSQDDIERTLAVIEEDKNGDTLAERLQKIAEFIAGTGSRFEDIERSLQKLLRLKGEFGELQVRLGPLEEKETGVKGVLQSLRDQREQLVADIDRLDKDEGANLATRVDQLAQAKKELEDQVSGLLEQFSRLDGMHKEISGLFAKLNFAQRTPRDLDPGVRIFAKSG